MRVKRAKLTDVIFPVRDRERSDTATEQQARHVSPGQHHHTISLAADVSIPNDTYVYISASVWEQIPESVSQVWIPAARRLRKRYIGEVRQAQCEESMSPEQRDGNATEKACFTRGIPYSTSGKTSLRKQSFLSELPLISLCSFRSEWR